MNTESCDVVVVGSGAGGGTVAQRLSTLPGAGGRVIVLEQGPRLDDHEFTGQELDMPRHLYQDGAAFLTHEGTMTLAFGRVYGGSTAVYTGTSLPPPEDVLCAWNVPDLDPEDLLARARRHATENNVHLLPDSEINENNRLFVEGCRALGWEPEQFPVNVRGCRGSSLCNLDCPNGAKQGTDRVQLPAAEAGGVEVVTRARVVRLRPAGDGGGIADVLVEPRPAAGAGRPSPWNPGAYEVHARRIVVCGGAVGSSALLLRSGLDRHLPRVGHGFTCHPAFILVGEHPEPITNDVGHPKSFWLDRAAAEGWVLETCMYFPFVTAKNLTGWGVEHERFMAAFERLQMILVLACDDAVASNRVTVGRRGEPRVHYRFTGPVRERLAAATRAATRIFFAAGARRVHSPLSEPATLTPDDLPRLDRRVGAEHFLPGRTSISAAHLMGGCGMGRDAGDSVTDAWGRVHGVPWLRVADASLFPDAIHINPYLSIMALADRVAEGVLEEVGSR